MSSSDVVRTLVLHSVAVAASVTSLRRAARPKASASDASALSAEDSIALQRLQKLYLAPYLLAVFCDWIQGPYQFRVYLGYGLTEAEIGRLYIAGFGSSLSLGTYIASLADVQGRKAACGWYCVACSLSCLSKNFSSYYILMLGRVFGGIATSLLFSAFEAWCVAEAGARHVSGGGLAKLFAGASFDNYVCAIVASLAGHLLVTLAGSVVAPFNAVPFVLLACWLRMRGWAENYGDDADLSGRAPSLPGGATFVSQSPSGLRRRDSDLHTPRGGGGGGGDCCVSGSDTGQSPARLRAGPSAEPKKLSLTRLGASISYIFSERRIVLLGLIGSLFDAALYIFIFLWTMALEARTAGGAGATEAAAAADASSLPHGLVFAVFMGWSMVGALSFDHFVGSEGEQVADQAGRLIVLLLVAACLGLSPLLLESTSFDGVFGGFCLLELAFGAFLPAVALLRAVHLKGSNRSAATALYRVPTNLSVVAVLFCAGSITERTEIALCISLLLVALMAAVALTRLGAPSAPCKRDGAAPHGAAAAAASDPVPFETERRASRGGAPSPATLFSSADLRTRQGALSSAVGTTAGAQHTYGMELPI